MTAPAAPTVRRYVPATDEPALLDLLRSEGDEWADYHRDTAFPHYRTALATSCTCVLYVGDALLGFIRVRDDDGYGVYVYDLLVHAAHRGHAYGRALLDAVRQDFPGADLYVMSDNDPYYESIAHHRIGTVFQAP